MRKVLLILAIMVLLPIELWAAGTMQLTVTDTFIATHDVPDSTFGYDSADSVNVTVVYQDGTVSLDSVWYNAADAQATAVNDALYLWDVWDDMNGTNGVGTYAVYLRWYDGSGAALDFQETYIVQQVTLSPENRADSLQAALDSLQAVMAKLILVQDTVNGMMDSLQFLDNWVAQEGSLYDPTSDSVIVDGSALASTANAVTATTIADDAIDYGTFAGVAPTAWWNEGKTGYGLSTAERAALEDSIHAQAADYKATGFSTHSAADVYAEFTSGSNEDAFKATGFSTHSVLDIWNLAFGTAFTAGSMGDSLNNSSYVQGVASGLTASEIRDSIWSATLSGDTTSGTTSAADFLYNAGDTSQWANVADVWRNIDTATTIDTSAIGDWLASNLSGASDTTTMKIMMTNNSFAQTGTNVVWQLRGLYVTAGGTDSNAVKFTGNGAGNGLYTEGGASGNGLYSHGNGNGSGIYARSDGTGGGSGMFIYANSSTGDALYAYSANRVGIYGVSGAASSLSGIAGYAMGSGNDFGLGATQTDIAKTIWDIGFGTSFAAGSMGDSLSNSSYVQGSASGLDSTSAAGAVKQALQDVGYNSADSTLNLHQLAVRANSTTDTATIFAGADNGHGLVTIGAGTGSGLYAYGGGATGHGAVFQGGNGIGTFGLYSYAGSHATDTTGAGMRISGGIYQQGMTVNGGSTDGRGLTVTSIGSKSAVSVAATAGMGLAIEGQPGIRVAGLEGTASNAVLIINDSTAGGLGEAALSILSPADVAVRLSGGVHGNAVEITGADTGIYIYTSGPGIVSTPDWYLDIVGTVTPTDTTGNGNTIANQTEVANINGWNPTTDSVLVDMSVFTGASWAENLLAFLGWGEVNGLPVWSKEVRNADVDTLYAGWHLSGGPPTIDTAAIQLLWHVGGAGGDNPDSTTSELWP